MKLGFYPLFFSALLLAGCGGQSGTTPVEPGGSTPPTLRSVVFTDLGIPIDLTADGTTTVGYSQLGTGISPVTWKDSSTTFESFPSAILQASLAAVTPNGAHILGVVNAGIGVGQPALFTPAGTITVLPLAAGKTSGYAVDLSDDGKVVLCLDATPTTPFHPRPYLVRNGAATYLPLPSGVTTAYASAISGDGRVVVGSINDQAAIWVNEGAPQLIASPQSGAKDVSRDGSVVIGTQRDGTAAYSYAFRWTATTGAVAITNPSYPNSGFAYGVSADGNTVLFASDASSNMQSVAQLWRNGEGVRSAAQLIDAAGGDSSTFLGAMPIKLSADGHTILGRGQRSSSGILAGAWKLTLP